MGDIIPNQKKFKFNKKVVGKKVVRAPIELGNVTEKVQLAILSGLDMFFACKCNEYTDEQLSLLNNMGSVMEAHIQVLWNLKLAIMYEEPRETLMRKLHAHNHIGQHIKKFGPILYADTDVYESSHKFFTTGVWRGTSKRLGTLVKEMTTASVVQSHSGHLNFYTNLLQVDGIAKCIKLFGPKPDNEDLIINAFSNICDIRFIITSELVDNTNILKGIGINKNLFRKNNLSHASLPSFKHLSQYLRYCLKDDVAEWN